AGVPRRGPGRAPARELGRAAGPLRDRGARPAGQGHALDADGAPAPGGRLPHVPPDPPPRARPPPRLPAPAPGRLVPHRALLQARVEPVSSAGAGAPREHLRRAARAAAGEVPDGPGGDAGADRGLTMGLEIVVPRRAGPLRPVLEALAAAGLPSAIAMVN